MTSYIQLLSLFVSFIFGFLFSLLTVLNFKLIDNYSKLIKHFITSIYVADMIILYIIVIYKINHGYIHLYFIIIVILAYFVGLYTYHKYLSKINVNRLFHKLKK